MALRNNPVQCPTEQDDLNYDFNTVARNMAGHNGRKVLLDMNVYEGAEWVNKLFEPPKYYDQGSPLGKLTESEETEFSTGQVLQGFDAQGRCEESEG
jgi:hypothetical protein